LRAPLLDLICASDVDETTVSALGIGSKGGDGGGSGDGCGEEEDGEEKMLHGGLAQRPYSIEALLRRGLAQRPHLIDYHDYHKTIRHSIPSL